MRLQLQNHSFKWKEEQEKTIPNLCSFAKLQVYYKNDKRYEITYKYLNFKTKMNTSLLKWPQ